VEWALSLAGLALLPKCPACVAAYFLFFTGIGLSLTTAATMRWILIALTITALACLVLRAVRRAGRVPGVIRAEGCDVNPLKILNSVKLPL
jgi:hypothetical protein